MSMNIKKALLTRKRRVMRVRKSLRGTALKPRMCVVKTNKHIQVQIIDDEKGVTLASLSTMSKELKNTPYCKRNKEAAKVLGEKIAEKAKAVGCERVVFDRGASKYHGVLAELANAARAGGLQF